MNYNKYTLKLLNTQLNHHIIHNKSNEFHPKKRTTLNQWSDESRLWWLVKIVIDIHYTLSREIFLIKTKWTSLTNKRNDRWILLFLWLASATPLDHSHLLGWNPGLTEETPPSSSTMSLKSCSIYNETIDSKSFFENPNWNI
jgi:hypothetical protein